MYRERQAILSLIALGRITPREAERLLAAWNVGREERWIIGACAMASLAQWFPSLAQLAHTFLSGHHAVAAITCWIGGII